MKEGFPPGNGGPEFTVFFDCEFPSHVFLTLQLKFCYGAEGNLSLIPAVRKGTRSSMDSSAGSSFFQLSYLCTGFVFYVKCLLDKNALFVDRVLYSKENGAESGMTSFSCIQLDIPIPRTGWVGVVFGQCFHLSCMQELSGRVLAGLGQKHTEGHAKLAHACARPKRNLYPSL